MKREYIVVYQPIEDGWIMATVPELPGAATQGRTMKEAREMMKEAVALLLESYRENAAKEAPGNAVWETLSVEIPNIEKARQDVDLRTPRAACFLKAQRRECRHRL